MESEKFRWSSGRRRKDNNRRCICLNLHKMKLARATSPEWAIIFVCCWCARLHNFRDAGQRAPRRLCLCKRRKNKHGWERLMNDAVKGRELIYRRWIHVGGRGPNQGHVLDFFFFLILRGIERLFRWHIESIPVRCVVIVLLVVVVFFGKNPDS